ncbi:MAG: hypothetical protein OZ921_12410 [Sorangiineae bacterium]|nr:hypothetical protein [Polyangiaceae bacterium]MEB2323309.1 hypothetical protein [Sorangiineae bacterium]
MTRRRPSRERGAAVFIVVMVIALLTAIGILAARTSSLVDSAAGYDRQATQTMYLASYAGRIGTVELGATPRTYLDLLRQGKEACPSNANVQPITTGAPIPCYKLFMSEVASRVATNFSSHTILDNPTAVDPGSLGPPLGQTPSTTVQMMNGAFMIELLEAYNSDPKAKSDVGGNPNAAHDVQVTLTAFAQLRALPSTGANTDPWCSDTSASTGASVQAIRAHVTLPNIFGQ